MIETNFRVSFVTALARREKQIQQAYRPTIGIHKWFARRPGTLFRALLLAEFSDLPLEDIFFKANQLDDITIADPFMGGGTTIIEANRMGAHTLGIDINPMSYWIVKQTLQSLNIDKYIEAAQQIRKILFNKIGRFYQTFCLYCNKKAPVKYFLWSKTINCPNCGEVKFGPVNNIIADKTRHPNFVILCPHCGELHENPQKHHETFCPHCNGKIIQSKSRSIMDHCPICSSPSVNSKLPPIHHMYAIEYYCQSCASQAPGRFFKRPDETDFKLFSKVRAMLNQNSQIHVPTEAIPKGDETARLFKAGYTHYQQLFNDRQKLGLEIICQAIQQQPDKDVKEALATNLSDLIRHQNVLCKYSPSYLKSQDVFSFHGFPYSPLHCEPNIIGIVGSKGQAIGSGGWLNIISKYVKAKKYTLLPYEYQSGGGNPIIIVGEWIGRHKPHYPKRQVKLLNMDARRVKLKPNSLNAVLTDPPYFNNLQYAELIDLCYVWLRRLLFNDKTFSHNTTRNQAEITGNKSMGRNLVHFTEGLGQTFINLTLALKPNSPFVFTYHHNNLEAYSPIIAAVLDAGLLCNTIFPCPSEMVASRHIHKSESSRLDSVFICRKPSAKKIQGKSATPKLSPTEADNQILSVKLVIQKDISELAQGGHQVSSGDIKCLVRGHLSKITMSKLSLEWNSNLSTEDKLSIIKKTLDYFKPEEIIKSVLEHQLA